MRKTVAVTSAVIERQLGFRVVELDPTPLSDGPGQDSQPIPLCGQLSNVPNETTGTSKREDKINKSYFTSHITFSIIMDDLNPNYNPI